MNSKSLKRFNSNTTSKTFVDYQQKRAPDKAMTLRVTPGFGLDLFGKNFLETSETADMNQEKSIHALQYKQYMSSATNIKSRGNKTLYIGKNPISSLLDIDTKGFSSKVATNISKNKDFCSYNQETLANEGSTISKKREPIARSHFLAKKLNLTELKRDVTHDNLPQPANQGQESKTNMFSEDIIHLIGSIDNLVEQNIKSRVPTSVKTTGIKRNSGNLNSNHSQAKQLKSNTFEETSKTNSEHKNFTRNQTQIGSRRIHQSKITNVLMKNSRKIKDNYQHKDDNSKISNAIRQDIHTSHPLMRNPTANPTKSQQQKQGNSIPRFDMASNEQSLHNKILQGTENVNNCGYNSKDNINLNELKKRNAQVQSLIDSDIGKNILSKQDLEHDFVRGPYFGNINKPNLTSLKNTISARNFYSKMQVDDQFCLKKIKNGLKLKNGIFSCSKRIR